MKKFVLFFFAISFMFGASSSENNTGSPLSPENFIAPTLSELKAQEQAQQSQTSNRNNNRNNKQNNSLEELTDLKKNQFYLNLDKEKIKEVQDKDKEIQEAFDGFSQKEINYKPMIRPISSMDSISLHPYFTTTLLLPSGSIIAHIDSSVPMAVLKYENNAIMIRPNSNFRVANLTIIYKLEDKNQVLNILATFYEKNKELDKLNLVYAYSNIQKLDDLEVINAYIRENGKFPTKKHSYIQINDVTYRIVEDDKYGNIFVNQKKYRVDNNTIYK